MPFVTLKNKYVMITGAASGIGLECARSFARRGANLVLTDVNISALTHAQREIAAMGVSCIALPCDIANEAAVQIMAQDTLSRIPSLHVLVNNAGIGYLGDFMGTDAATWRRLLDINVMGMVHMIQAFLPHMRAMGGPRSIVNIASTAGFAPPPGLSAYAASKFAAVGLSEVLAMELHHTPIDVVIVAPGIINTAIVRDPRGVSATVSDARVQRIQNYYQAKGCTPDVVAEDIVEGVLRGKPIVETGPLARLSCLLIRLSRSLARRLTVTSARQIGFIE